MKFDLLNKITNVEKTERDNHNLMYIDFIFPTIKESDYKREKRSLKIDKLEGVDIGEDLNNLEEKTKHGFIDEGDDMNIIAPNVMTKSIYLSKKLEYSYSNDYPSYLVKEKFEEKLNELVIDHICNYAISNPVGITNLDEFDLSQYKGEDSFTLIRKLVSKNLSISNYIATEGRIGPSNFRLINPDTIVKIVKKLGDISQLETSSIGGELIVNENVPKDYIILGRKNQIDQPGISVFYRKYNEIDVDNNKICYKFNISEIGEMCKYQYKAINLKGF